METTVDSFLPAGDPSVTQLDEKARSFGGDPIVVLLESDAPKAILSGQNLDQLVGLEGRLAGLPDVASVYGPATVLNQLAGRAQDLLAELTGRRDAVREQAVQEAAAKGAAPAQAQAAGTRAQDEFDHRYGPLLVQGMPAGLPTLSNQRFVDSVMYSGDGGVRAQWHFVVPSQNSVAVLVRPREGMDQEATARLVAGVRAAVGRAPAGASRVTISGVPVVASSIGEQVSREIPLIGTVALVAVALALWLVPWTRRRHRLPPLLVTLISILLTLGVFGWTGRTLSLGVVAFLSVLLGVGCYYPTYFTQRARRRTVLVVAGASAASFGMLMASPLPFVRDLGMTLSVGVVLSATTGGLLLRRFVPAEHRTDTAVRPVNRKRGVAAAALAAGLAVVGWCALPSLPLQADVEGFAAGLPSLGDAANVEQALGSSGEVDLVLRGLDVTTPSALQWMQQAQDGIVTAHGDQLRPVISLPSLLTFLGSDATAEQIDAGMRLLPPYLSSAVVRQDHQSSVLVFGTRINDLGALRQLRNDLLRQLPVPPAGYQVDLTGLPMAAVRGDELISGDRIWSNVLGILASGVVLAVGLRRRADALRAVAAATTATGLGLFALWATGVPLSPITVTLGSLTAAVGAEFTVVLAAAVRTGNPALRRSVVLAAVTSALGYAALAVSKLAVIQQFGLLLAGSVVLALASAACVVAVSVTGPARSSATPVEEEPALKTLEEVR
ncbi:RND transporter [Amycolatopsis acidiphila]|uniref:RND transporter n=1 Tax=Amycolatopsis acidiphila TaxID=715473 RepID=UPI001E30DA9A|nr:RND transporter [Amycolatopsis acidiphila]UIJ61696.1 RND transporter [Amycolatopsis acidiphila]